MIGSGGDDTLIGGDGNDFIVGGRGDDVALIGAGDDTFVWNPGDGSDTVEGQAGNDTLRFNGSNVNEQIDVSANGPRARLFRDVGNVAMDLNGVEGINVAALGGADTVTVNDLTGTGVKQVNLNLAGATGPGGPATARPTPSSSTAPTAPTGSRSPARLPASGLGPGRPGEYHGDRCDEGHAHGQRLGGDDSSTPAVSAGECDQPVPERRRRQRHAHRQRRQRPHHRRPWQRRRPDRRRRRHLRLEPRRRQRHRRGAGGQRHPLFNGANVYERFDVSANGAGVRLTRDVGNVVMDLNGVEGIDFKALGGADTVTVNDLTGTGLSQLNIDLVGTPGAAPVTDRPTPSSSTAPTGTTRSWSPATRAAPRSSAWPPW